MSKKTVLFICTHNSCRSQIAEAFLNSLYALKYKAYSAGVKPSNVNPYAIEVMKEIGIDLSKHTSKSIEEFKGAYFDYVVTVCDNAKENCPFFPFGANYHHKNFQDPQAFEGNNEEKLNTFRRIRDEIREWIDKNFINEVKATK